MLNTDPVAMKTQISGKYHPDNLELFAFKKRVQAAGLEVSYPVGDSIIAYSQGFAITVPEEGKVPFHDTELDFLIEIGKSDLQITYNKVGGCDGYLGESTAVETAWAMMLQKPVALIRPITATSPDISPLVLEIVERYIDTAVTLPLDKLEGSSLGMALQSIATTATPRPMSPDDRVVLSLETARLVGKYSTAWSRFCDDGRRDPAA